MKSIISLKSRTSKSSADLVSSYRYKGHKVNEDLVKSEAALLLNATTSGADKAIEDDEVVRKPHLQAIYITLDHVTQRVSITFCKMIEVAQVLDAALKRDADEGRKEALTRIVVTRGDADKKVINEAYVKYDGASLSEKINELASGNFKEFLLTLVARKDLI